MRGTFIEAHIADIHFGALDPQIQYQLLQDQFVNKIKDLPLQIISINGDLFDKKYMANSVVVTYANQFIANLVDICKQKNATLILISGTESHDAHQLNNFYHYLYRDDVDVRIVENMRFINVKGKEILCIPEETNMGMEYYMSFFRDREYDACYLHGTIVNSIYGFNVEDLNSNKRPTFSIKNFWRCTGPIMCGHVHIAQCLNSHIYYSGSPLRWQFGEEQDKGFMVLCHNLDTREYYVHFEPIVSFRYDTIDLDTILMSDPNEIIKYLNGLKESGIDHIRLKINKYVDIIPILKEYYRNKKWMTIEDKTRVELALKANEDVLKRYEGLEFLNDPNIDEYTKFCMYVNHYEGEGFVTVDRLKELITNV